MKPGEIIRERYQIDLILAQGETGITYKAFDLNTQCLVVIRLIHLDHMQDWQTLEIFEREASVLRQLNHPRIPTYIDHFTLEMPSEVQFVMVQEYIEGKTLHQLIEEGWRGTESEVLNIVRQIVDIFSYLHTLHSPVIHRDITPKHLMLSPTNEIYLIGFGTVEEAVFTTALEGAMNFGMNGYVPFEQFSGRAVPASDYYALGATLLYLLTHQHPSDFPSEKMKPKFQPYLHVSSSTLCLLDGLLEPSVEQRIASPEQVKAILAKTSEKLDITMEDSSKPFEWFWNRATKVEKIVKNHDLIHFCITGRNRETMRCVFISSFFLLFGFAAILYSVIRIKTLSVPCAILLPLGLAALMLGSSVLRVSGFKVFEQTILTLTPEWVHMNCKMFKEKNLWHIPKWGQIHFNPNRLISEDSWCLPTAAVRPSGFIWHAEEKKPWYVRRKNFGVGVNYSGDTLKLYTPLSEAQSKRLVKELNEYTAYSEHRSIPMEQIGNFLKETTSTHQSIKELSGRSKKRLSRKTQIDKIVQRRDHVRFQIIDKEKKKLILHIGVILLVLAFSFGTSLLMTSELRGPKTPSLKNLVLLRIMMLAMLGCPGSIMMLSIKSMQLLLKRTNRTILDLTPDWIEVSCKGLMYRHSWRMPTASFQTSPYLIWDFASKEPSGLIFNINHAGIAYYFFNPRHTEYIALPEQKAQWLIQELNKTLVEMTASGKQYS